MWTMYNNRSFWLLHDCPRFDLVSCWSPHRRPNVFLRSSGSVQHWLLITPAWFKRPREWMLSISSWLLEARKWHRIHRRQEILCHHHPCTNNHTPDPADNQGSTMEPVEANKHGRQ